MKDWYDPTLTKQARSGVTEQREHIKARPKRVEKPWAVCWSWRSLLHGGTRTSRHRFATEDMARRFMEKEQRRFSCHPNTGKAWGPAQFWIEGPNV